jgi:hypothetical protein
MQPTAFGARDRRHFGSFRYAPWRRLMRNPLDGNPSNPIVMEKLKEPLPETSTSVTMAT